MINYNNKSILITGGTGSLGRELTKYFIKNHPELSRIIIFSRDEQKQFLMNDNFDTKTCHVVPALIKRVNVPLLLFTLLTSYLIL